MCALTPAQALALENEAARLDAEKSMRDLNNLIAAISAAFSEDGASGLTQWSDKLAEIITQKR